MPSSPKTIAEKVRLLSEHERCKTSYVARPVVYGGGLPPSIETLARIHVVRPPKGHGERTLRVGVMSWKDGEVSYHYSEARGYGYDKLSAALQGASIDGHVLDGGLHTLRTIAHREGWALFGDVA